MSRLIRHVRMKTENEKHLREPFQIFARYDEQHIYVYQAYNDAIADAAMKHQTFAAPFKMERMTWIKPSWKWMLYRAGCGFKESQERILAVKLLKSGFDEILRQATLSTYPGSAAGSEDAWRRSLSLSEARIQWDPERDGGLQPIADIRAIQIGIKGKLVERYVREWIAGIEDVTAYAHHAKSELDTGQAITMPFVEVAYEPYGGIPSHILP